MSDSNWLERLNGATEYRDLQVAFSDLSAQARVATDGEQLASSIDEAIRRIELERLRDEDELQEFEQEYEQFRNQQSGVVGWFKRHIPFTETRRQEKQHKEEQTKKVPARHLTKCNRQRYEDQTRTFTRIEPVLEDQWKDCQPRE